MTENIYSLTITTGVDDYECRGESAHSCVTLYKTFESAHDALKVYLTKYLVELSTEYDFSYTPDEFDKFDYDYLLEEIIKSDGTSTYVFFDKMEIKDCDVHEIHDQCCRGKYIPYKWTYEIDEHNNPHFISQ